MVECSGCQIRRINTDARRKSHTVEVIYSQHSARGSRPQRTSIKEIRSRMEAKNTVQDKVECRGLR